MKSVFAITITALLVCSTPARPLHAAPSPLEQLGQAVHWLLTFVNDPYDTKVTEILELRPDLAAQALREFMKFPADGDGEEHKLLERFSTVPPKRLPKGLVKFVEREFKTWRKDQNPSKLKLQIVEAVPAVAVGEARVRDGRLLLPVAAIGRDLLRTVRDDKGLFKNFWWILSHPTFARTRPTGNTARFDLTGSCSLDPLKPVKKPCGGEAFYHSRREDVGSSVQQLERAFAVRLARTFSDALAK